MAGGIYTSQNKVRPGAYINFKSVPKPTGKVGSRGVVTLPIQLGWGSSEEIIEILSEDISNGALIDKIGYYGHEAEIAPIREALKNSYKLLLFRLDSNGQKATVTSDNLNIVAKYDGVIGNRISVVVKEANSKFEVITLIDTKVVDKQVVAKVEDLQSNKFVEFSGTGALQGTAGVSLVGGANGTVAQDAYSKYLGLVESKKFDTMGVFTNETTIKENVLNFIKDLRENKGKKVQVVINEFNGANYEGVISVDQGYKTVDTEIDVKGFVGYMAGLTAGAALNKSNTYHVIPNAVSIINPKNDEEITKGIIDGKLMLSYSNDEKVVIETDINTFTGFSKDKSKDFSKNRVMRTLDNINNSVKSLFENTYLGKVDNSESGRTSFKSDIIVYLKELVKLGAIEEFENDEIVIQKGEEIDSVVVALGVKPIDAMEKLYMTVSVG
ncbi:phage tail sheath C-terminal domain-containing protein [Clostridium chrysemydis]|uniref:phage tail sheath C-terminal domain-containing protein n=1 Tax=Clostridium chrysemydis TaxID=2665504 RepID=UPI0018834991|nr:phage tail sheath C-terminal domain-containing protein [Clostridium chrysemydis]